MELMMLSIKTLIFERTGMSLIPPLGDGLGRRVFVGHICGLFPVCLRGKTLSKSLFYINMLLYKIIMKTG